MLSLYWSEHFNLFRLIQIEMELGNCIVNWKQKWKSIWKPPRDVDGDAFLAT